MFGISFSELLLVGLVALLVLGPERLPGAARTAGLGHGGDIDHFECERGWRLHQHQPGAFADGGQNSLRVRVCGQKAGRDAAGRLIPTQEPARRTIDGVCCDHLVARS